jgi:ABC-type antimicrobial peptide transport system permease subunit
LVWSVTVAIRHVLPLDISWMAVVVALVVSSGVGVVFGYRPASEAANLNPIEALRTE